MADARVNHGGLYQSIHNRLNDPDLRPAVHSGNNLPTSPVNGSVTCPVISTIENLVRNRDYNSGSNRTYTLSHSSLADSNRNRHNVSTDDRKQDTDIRLAITPILNDEDMMVEFQGQFQSQARNSHKIDIMGSFYALESMFRSELWDSMKLKMPEYQGYESCALVRNPSINLEDLRCRSALTHAWWKLGRWLARLMRGDEINLLESLEGESSLISSRSRSVHFRRSWKLAHRSEQGFSEGGRIVH
ncbi:hypothetical protein PG994_002275 [Apiospora phragmitis]|uniref:Uncharacterized protein n=1 Tax=Apiospora phragmitis TaxID=2905665 RepID=A0ABR1WVX8_9PEZI